MSAQEKTRARTLRILLEANANWNAERRRYDGHNLQQLEDATSTINPELRKELLYSWEKSLSRINRRGRNGIVIISFAGMKRAKVRRL